MRGRLDRTDCALPTVEPGQVVVFMTDSLSQIVQHLAAEIALQTVSLLLPLENALFGVGLDFVAAEGAFRSAEDVTDFAEDLPKEMQSVNSHQGFKERNT